jgi:hypothetical protein
LANIHHYLINYAFTLGKNIMKSWHYSLIALLTAASLLSACSGDEKAKKETAPAPVATVAPAAPAVEAAPAKKEPGGYVPTEEERYHPETPATAEPSAVAPVAAEPASAEAAPAEAK